MHFQVQKRIGSVTLRRLYRAVDHRLEVSRSDDENCVLCQFYKDKRGHCTGCPAYDCIYIGERQHGRKGRTPYRTLCRYYQALCDAATYPDGSAHPPEIFVQEVLRWQKFLKALRAWLWEHEGEILKDPKQSCKAVAYLGTPPEATWKKTAPVLEQKVTYKTDRNTFHIHVGATALPREFVETEVDFDWTKNACFEGCKKTEENFSCPPHSPSFTKMKPTATTLVLAWARFPTNEWERSGNPLRLMQLLSFTDRLTVRLVRRAALRFVETNEGLLLGGGACMSCNKCAKKTGGSCCSRPEKRIHALEAVGIRVDRIMARLGKPLEWYVKGTGTAPDVIAHVFGVLGTWDIPSTAKKRERRKVKKVAGVSLAHKDLAKAMLAAIVEDKAIHED